MDNSIHDNELELGKFGNYLLQHRLVPERNAKYYVLWVRKFLRHPVGDPRASLEDRIRSFIEGLEAENRLDGWQIEQAERAILLFFTNFRSSSEWNRPPPRIQVEPDGAVCAQDAMAAAQSALQLKHYSYRTEVTYLDWIRRFFTYLKSLNSGGQERLVVSPEAVKNYLAFLAENRQVSASTQNQAFNAILFLCREVLRIEMGAMDHALRARTGIRLPTVFSVDEVKSLLAAMSGLPALMAALTYGGGLRVMECCRL